MDQKNYCVIMAGGIGSRFWPLSRTQKPKQFLDILGIGKTLLQSTFDRFSKFIPKENIYIVSNELYKDIILEQLPGIKEEQVLLEPSRKNTAPCIAYAAFKIHKINPQANIIVAPSDHLIIKEEEFKSLATQSLEFVSKNNDLLTMGINPTYPATGYGYIQTQENNDEKGFKKVKTFTEKPDYEMAKVFYESGDFYWNSGIFIWSVKAILDAMEEHATDIFVLFHKGGDVYSTPGEKDFIEKTYAECPSISIDYAIMEKAENVYMLPSNFDWSDLGTWSALYELMDKDENKNAINAKNVYTYDTNKCTINVSNDKLLVVSGLSDYIVVEKDNMILICPTKDEQNIKQFQEEIKNKDGNKYV
jgi:mannose-1-phosphate guanylyltransferase